MWCRSYRNHVIMAFPSFDTATGLWAPQANISWVVGAARESEFVRFAKRVLTEAEAVVLALNAARAWVDRRLRTPPAVARREIQDPVRRTVAGRLTRNGANVSLPRAAKSDNTRTLTFNQFKSWMGKTGLSGSPQSLHKSYAALLQLRKQDHRSWAQIKFKIRRSQESTPDAQALASKMKFARLPLTMRDWRRII